MIRGLQKFSVFTVAIAALATNICAQNSAVVPDPNTPKIWGGRWEEKLARVKQGDLDLIMVGDSITHAWDNPENQAVWSAYFGPRKAVSLGYSGARTQNILWMLENGKVDGISPKVAVVMIGTNNTDKIHFGSANTPVELAEGVKLIVKTLQTKLPKTKILLLRIFPREDMEGAGEIGAKASDIFKKMADGKSITYLDINSTFLKPDGHLDTALMPDKLHPNQLGNYRWAEAMEPSIRKLMGRPENSATTPAEAVEDLGMYDWKARHEAAIAYAKSHKVGWVLIGDSITHFWGGEPTAGDKWQWGAKSWIDELARYYPLNLGFGWDRTQQVLWRIDHGELDGLQPKVVSILIGTNNLAKANGRANTNQEIVEGIQAIVKRVHQKCPSAKVLLLGILPRDSSPLTANRARILDINHLLRLLNGKDNVTFLNIGPGFVKEDGTLLPDITTDALHPNGKGYEIMTRAMVPLISKWFKE